MDYFINNPFCELLGIKYPVIQGGMAYIADAKLAAAVSNAGGLGIISGVSPSIEHLREQIREAKRLTDKPFGINIMLMHESAPEVAKLVIEEGVRVVSTGAGNPSVFLDEWNKADIKVLSVIPSVSYARLMERSGVSAVIAEGQEAGGHIGELTTMTLVPQVVDAVKIPVAAAGGIADGRGIAAAFMLGASAVQIGTRFLIANECNIHQNYKDMVIKAGDIDTNVTGRRTGHPIRGLKSQFTRNFIAKESDPSITNEEIAKLGAGALKTAAVEGCKEKGYFMAGQSAGLIKKEQTVKEIIDEMFSEFIGLMNGANKYVK